MRLLAAARACRDESGVALVLALLVTLALTISTTAVVQVVTSNQKAFSRDKEEARALNTAEAGVNYALSTLATTVDPNGSVAVNTWYPSSYGSNATPVSFNDSSGKGTWWAQKTSATRWAVYSTGVSPTGKVTRKLSVQVNSSTAPGTPIPSSKAWSYGLFVGSPGNSCFTPIGNADLTISIYVKGCITLSGSAGIQEPAASTAPSIRVYAETTISISGGGAKIGQSTKKVLSVVAPNGCTGKSGIICSQPGSNVFAMSTTGPSQNVTKPTISPATEYAKGLWSSPVCSVGSFTFDNDTVRNTSVGTVDLFTAGAFDCVVSNSSGVPVGRLKWTPATNSLVAYGMVFIDGDLRMNSNTAAQYTTPDDPLRTYLTPWDATAPGATIYVGGTVLMNGTASLCGPPSTASGGGCSGTWNGTTGAIVLVAANQQNSNNPLSVGWNATGNAYYDLAAYVVGQYVTNGSSGITGPVVTDTAAVSGSQTQIDLSNPPPTAPGTKYTSPGSTSWGVIPATWRRLPTS